MPLSSIFRQKEQISLKTITKGQKKKRKKKTRKKKSIFDLCVNTALTDFSPESDHSIFRQSDTEHLEWSEAELQAHQDYVYIC